MAKQVKGKGKKVSAKQLADFDSIKPQLKKDERWVTVNGKHMIVKKEKKRK